MTATRRTGEACDVAQNSADRAHGPPGCGVGKLMVRLDSDRQKFTSAVQLPLESHWLKESTAPLITTSPGEAPRPATLV